jgi:hypothetical protein
VCAASTCTTCPANSPTCNAALTQDPSLANQLCGVPQQDYVAVIVCLCGTNQPCTSACGNNYCVGQAVSSACQTCLSTAGATGCGDQVTACETN